MQSPPSSRPYGNPFRGGNVTHAVNRTGQGQGRFSGRRAWQAAAAPSGDRSTGSIRRDLHHTAARPGLAGQHSRHGRCARVSLGGSIALAGQRGQMGGRQVWPGAGPAGRMANAGVGRGNLGHARRDATRADLAHGGGVAGLGRGNPGAMRASGMANAGVGRAMGMPGGGMGGGVPIYRGGAGTMGAHRVWHQGRGRCMGSPGMMNQGHAVEWLRPGTGGMQSGGAHDGPQRG